MYLLSAQSRCSSACTSSPVYVLRVAFRELKSSRCRILDGEVEERAWSKKTCIIDRELAAAPTTDQWRVISDLQRTIERQLGARPELAQND